MCGLGGTCWGGEDEGVGAGCGRDRPHAQERAAQKHRDHVVVPSGQARGRQGGVQEPPRWARTVHVSRRRPAPSRPRMSLGSRSSRVLRIHFQGNRAKCHDLAERPSGDGESRPGTGGRRSGSHAVRHGKLARGAGLPYGGRRCPPDSAPRRTPPFARAEGACTDDEDAVRHQGRAARAAPDAHVFSADRPTRACPRHHCRASRPLGSFAASGERFFPRRGTAVRHPSRLDALRLGRRPLQLIHRRPPASPQPTSARCTGSRCSSTAPWTPRPSTCSASRWAERRTMSSS